MPEAKPGPIAPVLSSVNLALLLILGVLWGTAFLFITVGLRSFSPVLFVAIRFYISGTILLGIALLRRGGPLVPRGRRQWGAVAVAAVFNVAGYHSFLFWGQQYTTAGVAAIIVGLNPVLTTVFSHALLKDERLGSGGVLGLGVGMAGIVLLASLKPGNLFDFRGIAELAIFVAIASWALGSVLVRRFGHRMDVTAVVAWQSLVGAGILHLAAISFEGGGRAVFDASGILSMLYLSVVSSGVGFLMYFTLLPRIGPVRLNSVSQIAAAVAAVGGILLLREPVELRAIGAFVLIAAGFYLVTRPQVRARRPRDAAVATGNGSSPLDRPPDSDAFRI